MCQALSQVCRAYHISLMKAVSLGCQEEETLEGFLEEVAALDLMRKTWYTAGLLALKVQ